MIRLHPIPEVRHSCPGCNRGLEIKGWRITGMRNLADLHCSSCGREFWGDLPSGHGLHYPVLMETNGEIHSRLGPTWFEDWLAQSFAGRHSTSVRITSEEFRPVRKAVLLNCLDGLYGHCLLKLFNAQYYLDHRPELDLILLIPSMLRWLAPEGVAEIWTVDLSPAKCREWNDWLAEELFRRVSAFGECGLSVAVTHPSPSDFQIERFTGVSPFPPEEWSARLKAAPTITFIWRSDRLWLPLKQTRSKDPGRGQEKAVIKLAESLRTKYPDLSFAVAGLGHSGNLPEWIVDLRRPAPDPQIERMWVERYAQSHIVIGVHGSNMLIPSGHAGSVIEMIPDNRWGNLLQDIILQPGDWRTGGYRLRFLPESVDPETIAVIAKELLRSAPHAWMNFADSSCNHPSLTANPYQIIEKRYSILPHFRRES